MDAAGTASLVEQLGTRLRTAADELPVGEVTAAADRLRGAVELLAWIRHESTRGIGVTPLAVAVEHLEHALRALLVAQEEVAAYLAAIGLAGDAAVVAGPEAPARRPPPRADAPAPGEGEPAARLRRWWAVRVDELTGYGQPRTGDRAAAGEPDGAGGARERGRSRDADGDPADGAAADSAELLRRVAGHAGGGDRAALRAELRRVTAATGLGLAALTPTALHRIAAEVLGHPPGPGDVAALRAAAGSRLRDLLPNLDPRVGEVLLARTCRVPVRPAGPDRPDPPAPPHPADSAMAGGVLTGLLLRRAGRDPSALDRYLVTVTEPTHA
ncbi:hypothetical protein ACNTMW_27175 [Planosporangium sp. 12N6]